MGYLFSDADAVRVITALAQSGKIRLVGVDPLSIGDMPECFADVAARDALYIKNLFWSLTHVDFPVETGRSEPEEDLPQFPAH